MAFCQLEIVFQVRDEVENFEWSRVGKKLLANLQTTLFITLYYPVNTKN
jgi:hypothetical protein